MNAIQSIILGIIQGLTEFLPISSSAHLSFIPSLLNWENTSMDFDVFLHIATLFAVILYFRKDLYNMASGIFSKKETTRKEQRALIRNLLVAFSVLFPFVFLLNDVISATENNLVLTYSLLIIFGIPLLFVEKLFAANKIKAEDLGWKKSLTIGLAQCFALFSGVSRSGFTIITGMTQGLSKEEAKRFAFLLSVPTITAGFAWELLKISQNFQFKESWEVIAVGSLAAFLSGFLAIKLMMDWLGKYSLAIFGYYRIIVGTILLLVTVL